MAHWTKVRTQPSAQHLTRWYNHCARQPVLAALGEQHAPNPRKAAPSNAAASKGDLSSSVAVFGKGGGGTL